MAELLGKQDDAAMFYKLSQNYKTLFDPSTGFMRPKTADGKWRDPFQSNIQYRDYVEADAWQTSFGDACWRVSSIYTAATTVHRQVRWPLHRAVLHVRSAR